MELESLELLLLELLDELLDVEPLKLELLLEELELDELLPCSLVCDSCPVTPTSGGRLITRQRARAGSAES